MAKKNSSKTATKESISASEPRLTSYNKWQGMYIDQSTPGWKAEDSGYNPAALQSNYFMIQDNIKPNDQQTVEVREQAELLCYPIDGYYFGDIQYLWYDILFSVLKKKSDNVSPDEVYYHRLTNEPSKKGTWTKVNLVDHDSSTKTEQRVTRIGMFQNRLIIAMSYIEDNIKKAELYTAEIDPTISGTINVDNAIRIPEATQAPTLTPKGSLSSVAPSAAVCRISFFITYTNKFGTTSRFFSDTGQQVPVSTGYYDKGPEEWYSGCYLTLNGIGPANVGVDVYRCINDASEYGYCGHSETDANGYWSYNWLGAMADTSTWTTAHLTPPNTNTTKGVNATHFKSHDGKLFYWGDPDYPYRLYWGGNAGNEMSCAIGYGGGFVDIDPGSGLIVNGTEKFKTYNGASIVTVLCGNPNTGRVKRFNLLDTETSISSELSIRGYMTEEVTNVVGCLSSYGHGVFEDGLYCITRDGLALTTQAEERNNQLQVHWVSDAISPVFDSFKATSFEDTRLLHIKDTLYLLFPNEINYPYESAESRAWGLNRILFCYRIDQKAWYTYSFDSLDLYPNAKLSNVIEIDFEDFTQGLCFVEATQMTLLPHYAGGSDLTSDEGVNINFTTLLESGELSMS
ncbi:MAG: hypothetical protein HUJ56_04205, partial [Erysipelotrichaceae bacterium]|nr:hypothetical protein [Erysipelotrichaceae bacterium]